MERDHELRWIDPGVPETRADVCQVQTTQEETSLLFGMRQGAATGNEQRARLERRVLLSPQLAKQLAESLAAVLREHERLHGMENATPAGTFSTPPGEGDAPAAARPLLDKVRALGAGFGFEKSFKLSAAGLQDERLILGVRSRAVDPQALVGVCRSIGMPKEYLEEFVRVLPEANTVGFGYEGNGAAGGAFKVYLEFWERLRARVLRDPGNRAPAELFLGFKWQGQDPKRRAIARYTCYPLLSTAAIASRMEALYAGGGQPSLAAARALLEAAALRAPGDSFVYVEAAEEGNPRRSFDLNLYKAGLMVRGLRPVLASLAPAYGIAAAELEEMLERAGGQPLGHLSGGVGRDGQDFLTVYYELEGL